ncbi:MAG: hypothetical protein V1708_05780 [Candidatus Micrarchaeota archaeon]
MRQAIILVFLLLAAFALYMAMPLAAQRPVADNTARQFVLEDAKNDYPSATVEVLNAEKSGGAWQIDVKIALDAHSKCPKIYKRYYNYPPIYFREEVINDKCAASGSIIYSEEAILASAKTAAVMRLPDSASASARSYSGDEIKAMQACAISCSDIEEFSKQLPAAKLWIIEWQYGSATTLVAVDEYGKALASG